MDLHTKEIISATAVVLTLVSYIPYVQDIFKGKTHPHIFSWIIWSLLLGITYTAQLAGGGGVGTWAIGLTAVLCAMVAVLSIKRGEKNITQSDWACFIGALLAIPAWQITNSPLYAVVIVTLIDILSFIPTFRKTYAKPESETLILYTLAAIKFFLVTISLEDINMTTALYPIVTLGLNLGLVAMALLRREQTNPAT